MVSRKIKISATGDEALWNEVQVFVAGRQGAESASAAVEHGLSLWVANQRLATALAVTYAEILPYGLLTLRSNTRLRFSAFERYRARFWRTLGLG